MRRLSVEDNGAWQWTMMILQPDFVTAAQAAEAVAEAQRKKRLPALARIRFEAFAERPAVQILHSGPYAADVRRFGRLHAHIEQNGWQRAGKHHEIYLKDPRKSAPEKLLTVLRQPFRE